MSKARVNKKEQSRLERKAAHAIAVETAQRIRLIAETITNNGMLRTMLMQEPDVQRRKQLFDFMKPHLKFDNPEFPTLIEPSRIIRP